MAEENEDQPATPAANDAPGAASEAGANDGSQAPEEARGKAGAEGAAGKAAGAEGEAVAAKPAAAEKPAAARPAAAEKPTGAKPATQSAPGVTRRGFFSWAAVAWVGFTAAIGGCVTAWGRFMFPNVLYEPPTSFKVGKPEDFPPGVVDTRFKDEFGVWIVNNEGQLYALIAICTHLGCPPNWLDAQNKFKCPCHGSGYYKSGINFEGPTPRPLERAKISVSPEDGQIVVDKAQKFQWELGQWEDPNSFIPVSA